MDITIAIIDNSMSLFHYIPPLHERYSSMIPTSQYYFCYSGLNPYIRSMEPGRQKLLKLFWGTWHNDVLTAVVSWGQADVSIQDRISN